MHRSFVVSLAAVQEMKVLPSGDYELTLRSGATVPMSRTFRDDVITKLRR